MSEHIFETFDGLFRVIHGQGRRLEELERRVADLEAKLEGKVLPFTPQTDNAEPVYYQCGECKGMELNLVGGYCWSCASLRV